LLNRRVAAGTADISEGPAMSRAQALQAVETGIQLAADAKADGCKILLTGEMGIGNTTTSAAMAAVLLGADPAQVTGRGAGLSSEGLRRKTAVVRRAIEVNRPDAADPLGVLAALGGFDIAGLCGVFIGGAAHRLPVLCDGLISTVAALCAVRLFPAAGNAMLASHVSAEPAGRMLLDALGLAPLICAGMYLGEGSGAVAALPLLDMAYAVYDGMRTFEEIEIESYLPLA
jgi:nicotinate-nucleotide--dimethylbenzimidazole phosphoribosyltransferase